MFINTQIHGGGAEKIKEKNFKYRVLAGITISFTVILISRLFYLQVLKYKTIAERAQYSTSKISILSSPRGIIYDRNGKILASNKQSISLVVYPNKLKNKTERIKVLNTLEKILSADSYRLKDALLKLPEDAPLPIRLQSSISVHEASQIVEKQHMLPGIGIQEEPIRYYPNGSIASHVLGYISQIGEDELSFRPDRKSGDLVGRSGVERLFDDILRGVDGKKIVEVDRYGKPINPDYKHSVIHINPKHGENVYLTLDLDLQKTAEDALKKTNSSSALIATDPRTGEILALASYPTFDPNLFTKPISISTWDDFLKKKVFLNHALLAYTPGSLWKPITLLSALDSMVLKPTERFNVSDAIYLGSTRFGDWTTKKENLSLEECLAWSRDTAFYQIAQRLKPEQMKAWGLKLGAGRKTGIELLGEEAGIVPDEAWKKRNLKEPWYPGNTLHYSIGQGFLLVTPLQIARIYSAIANGSQVPRLQVVKKVSSYIKPLQIADTFEFNPGLMKVVKKGLELCVEKGTGIASRLGSIKVAGKTGSAEVHGSNKTHSWFVAYAPSDKPEIVVVVLVEKAGHGGTVAAPVVKQVLEAYFENKEKHQIASK